METSTTLGDVLVFGLDEDFPDGVDGPELLRHVHESGGAAVPAVGPHPFRRSGGCGLWQWLEQQGLSLDATLATRPELAWLHAAETLNGEVNGDELAKAEELARILGLPATGGSDAHSVNRVGVTVTEFTRPVSDERELVSEIRAGRIRPRRR